MSKGFLKGLILKDNPNDSTSQSVEPGKQPQIKSPAQIVTTNSIQGVADNKFIQLLEGIIEQNNLPGQDYFEFKQAIENMKALAMDERTKFQTVFTVLSLQGCKKDVLLSSLDKYVQIIQNEKANFDVELKAEYAKKVQAKMDEAEKSKKELEALTKRLSELNNSVLALTQEAQAEEMKIRATEANFKASADVIINEMINDKEKINNFIS